jgi:CCR4-NOT transcription complex subunit 6
MGKKGRRGNKQETVSMANLEVVSAESFQQRLEGMSSCVDCLKERSKDAVVSREARGRRHRKPTRVRLNSPIVVRLQDTIKVSVKHKLKPSPRSSDIESESSSSDDGSSLKKETVSLSRKHLSGHLLRLSRNDKNFNAFLSAIEKVHLKDHGTLSGRLENLEEYVCRVKDKAVANTLLNNSINCRTSINDKDGKSNCRSLEAFIQSQNIDLICNDLSSKSSAFDSDESSTDEPSEDSSALSSPEESSSESDLVSSSESLEEELSKEELERLTNFTTGFAVTKYECLPYECPECLAAYYTYAQYHTQGSDFYKSQEEDYDLTDVESDSSESAESSNSGCPPPQEVIVKSGGKVEVSVAWLSDDKKLRKRKSRYQKGNSVTVDLSDTDVEFSVQYHPDTPLEQSNHVYQQDWYFYNSYNVYGFIPYAYPYAFLPPYYMMYPLWYATIPKPICVPRDLQCLKSQRLCMVPAHEVKAFTASQPPQRPWIPVAHPERSRPVAIYTVMCYNVLCDKYATRQIYGYCPSWALNWEYRKKGIIEEIRHYSADIISLQEVETDQFYNFFLPELKKDGYDGIFSPKSRARTMLESEKKHVDGCAIFFRTSKFSLLKEHLIEFNQLAMASADGSHDMLNRVMTKDNIGLAALLETKERIWENGTPPEGQIRQPLLVATCHVHWDPEFSDVKLIQTMMLMSELKNIIDDTQMSFRPGSQQPDPNSTPLILCGDLNSLPESGVVEYLLKGRVSANHEDFKELGYDACLQKLSANDMQDNYAHSFRLGRGYTNDSMPYTNYTFDFKGVIDYILYSKDLMRPLGCLGMLDLNWFAENKVLGCPHPHVPSDHLPLLVELEMLPAPPAGAGSTSSNSNSSNNTSSRGAGHIGARR